MSGSALSKAWRWSGTYSPILNFIRLIRYRGLPNRHAFALLNEADLPVPVDGLIRMTVKRSKLWASERAEIARELIAHAHDAIEAGQSGEEIAIAFGDPKRIAKLMRRSMKRKRPLYWRTYRNLKRAIAGVLLLMVLFYGVIAVQFYTGKPKIKRNYIAELNARNEGYSEDEKAWGVIDEVNFQWKLQTQAELERQSLRVSEAATNEYSEGILSLPSISTDHPDYTSTSALVRSFHDELSKVRQAAMRPVTGMLYTNIIETEEVVEGIYRDRLLEPETDPYKQVTLIEILLPSLSEYRALANLLAFDSQLAIEDGDFDRAVENYITMFNLARQCSEEPFFISQLVGVAIHSMAEEHIATFIRDLVESISREHLIELAHANTTSRARQSFGIEAEKMMFEDVLQRCYTDDGNGDGRLTPKGAEMLAQFSSWSPQNGDDLNDLIFEDPQIRRFAGPLLLISVSSRRQERQKYMAIMDNVLGVLANGPETIGQLVIDSESVSRRDNSLISAFSASDMLTPALIKAVERAFRAQQSTDATGLMLAIEAYKKDIGWYPYDLDDLVPQYLPKIPADLMDPGHGMKYNYDESGYIIYSVGSDGDDDLGIEPRTDSGKPYKGGDHTQFRLRFGYEMVLKDGKFSIHRDESRVPVMLEPRGPDGDWILVDMRCTPETPPTAPTDD